MSAPMSLGAQQEQGDCLLSTRHHKILQMTAPAQFRFHLKNNIYANMQVTLFSTNKWT